MKILTDSKELEDVKDPDACNVFALYKLFADEAAQAELAERYRAGGMGYGHAKTELYETMERYFEPMRERRMSLEKDPDFVEDVLRMGAKRASKVAQDVLGRAREAVGLA